MIINPEILILKGFVLTGKLFVLKMDDECQIEAAELDGKIFIHLKMSHYDWNAMQQNEVSRSINVLSDNDLDAIIKLFKPQDQR
jgi:hypothetical protein